MNIPSLVVVIGFSVVKKIHLVLSSPWHVIGSVVESIVVVSSVFMVMASSDVVVPSY